MKLHTDQTELYCSYAINDMEFMKWLIDLGADIDNRPYLDQPVLSYAIASGDIQVVHFLLAKGADVMHGNLLHYAVERTDQREGAELIEILAHKGADVNARRHFNAAAWRFKAMSFLPTPLYLACHHENIPAVHALLKCGADPARKILCWGRDGPSALGRARSLHNPELSALLLQFCSKI